MTYDDWKKCYNWDGKNKKGNGMDLNKFFKIVGSILEFLFTNNTSVNNELKNDESNYTLKVANNRISIYDEKGLLKKQRHFAEGIISAHISQGFLIVATKLNRIRIEGINNNKFRDMGVGGEIASLEVSKELMFVTLKNGIVYTYDIFNGSLKRVGK